MNYAVTLRRSLNGADFVLGDTNQMAIGSASDRDLLVQLARSGFRAANCGPGTIFFQLGKEWWTGHRVTYCSNEDVNTLIYYCQSETDLWLISSPN